MKQMHTILYINNNCIFYNFNSIFVWSCHKNDIPLHLIITHTLKSINMIENQDNKNEYQHKRPQDFIPTELITHYIVKDYRRMYLNFDDLCLRNKKAMYKIDELTLRAEKAESKLEKLTCRAEDAESKVKQLTHQAEKTEAKIEELKQKNNEKSIKKEKNEKLQAQVQEQQDEIKSLKEKLEKAKQQNLFLAQAIVSQLSDEDQKPQLIQGLLLSIDPKELEKKIGTQLGDAYLKLNTIEQRLNSCQEAIEFHSFLNGDSNEMKILKGNLVASIGKIESAVKHIDNFYKLVNGIPII